MTSPARPVLGPEALRWLRYQRELGTDLVELDRPLALDETADPPAAAAGLGDAPRPAATPHRPAPTSTRTEAPSTAMRSVAPKIDRDTSFAPPPHQAPRDEPRARPTHPAPVERPAPAVRSPASARPSPLPRFSDLPALVQHAAACERCLLGGLRRRGVVSGGAERSPWMVLTLYAWAEDIDHGALLSGAYARPFHDLARTVGLPPPAVGAVLACPPPNPQDLAVQGRLEATRCRGYWTQRLELSGARAILVLDQRATQLALGRAIEWPAFRGERFELEGRPALSTHHPARLARQTLLGPDVEADLRAIASLLSPSGA